MSITQFNPTPIEDVGILGVDIMENAVMYADTRLREQSNVSAEKLMGVKE